MYETENESANLESSGASPSPEDPSSTSSATEATPPSAEPAPVPGQIHGGPTQPSLDADKHDSLGNEKEAEPLGPRGANAPRDVMTDAERKQLADAHEKRLSDAMSSTDKTDSIGGAKEEHHAVGPRGHNAPPDTFHKK